MRRIIALLLSSLLIPAVARRALADDASSREYEIKAALIYKFSQFTQWPGLAFSGSDDPLVIATVGPDPFDGALESVIAGKTIGSRKVVVKHFADADHIGRCHVLFVARELVGQTAAIVKNLTNAPVLLMADTDGFCQAGGILQFFIEDQKVHFEINTDQAVKCGLKMSSQLMRLAKVYKQS